MKTKCKGAYLQMGEKGLEMIVPNLLSIIRMTD